MRIFWMGAWKDVVIDNFFPVANGKPCFSHSKENEIWVLILEKAWAKLWGNYGRIEAGLCRDALRDLTGAPTKVIRCEVRNI